jgi:autotransporter-associated beta strand protein
MMSTVSESGKRGTNKTTRQLQRVRQRSLLVATAAALAPLSGFMGRSAHAANGTWLDTGGSSANWSDPTNWVNGTVPGATGGTTTDTSTATFNTAVGTFGTSGNPIFIDQTQQNIGNITFDTASVGSFFIGSTSGNSLLLTSGGTIQLTATAITGNETINAPLVLEGNDTFTNNSTSTGLLDFGGNISGASGATVLTLNGSNTGANTIAGNIGNGTATSLAITKSGGGLWTLAGSNSYTGATTLSAGTLVLQANASNTSGNVTSALSNSTPELVLSASTTLELLGNSNNTIFEPANSGGGTNSGSGGTVSNGSGDLTTGIVEASGSSGPFNIVAGDSNNGSTTGQTLILGNFGQFGPGSTAPTFNFAVNNGYTLQIGSGTEGTGQLDIYNNTTINSTVAGGTLAIPGGIDINYHSAYTLTFGGAGNITLGGLVQNASNAINVTSNSAATVSLTGASAMGTGTLTLNSGTFQVGNGTTGSLTGPPPLTFGGTGTIIFDEAASSSQSMGALTNSAGEATVQSTFVGTSATVTFSSLGTRTAGATVNFVTSGGTNGSTNTINLTGTSAGFISQGDFFGGSNYAYMNTAGGYVREINYGVDTNTGNATGSNAISGNATTNVQLTGNVTAQGNVSISTLNMGNNSLALTTGTAFQTNGILESGGNATISGGSSISTATSGTELVIRANLATDNLNIMTPIIANGTNALTKSGLGTLTLSGTGNTYTGGMTVDGGVLTLAGTLTGGAGTSMTVRGGATLNINAAINAGTITLSPAAGSVAIVNLNASYTAGNDGIFDGSVANGGISVLNMAANATWINAGARFSAGDTGFGVINITAGAVTPGGSLIAGNSNAANGSVGIFNISGGSVTENTSGTAGSIGAAAGAIGVMNVTGTGAFTSNFANTASGLYVGNSGTGILNIAGTGALTLGGGIAASKGLDFAQGATTGNGIVNLGAVSGGGSGGSGGGTITTNVVQMGTAGASIFNFHGGTLKATATNVTSAFMTGLTNAYVWNEGGTVDNNGQAITIGQALLAPTGSGVNTLTLGGTTTGFTPGATPLVVISGGGGTGATAISNVDSGGNLTLTITNPGTGYTTAPIVSFIGTTGVGSTSATATIGANSGGGLTFQGNGTTTLSGNNTYSGGTTLNAGTLSLSASGTLGATTGPLAVNNPNLGAGTAVVLNLATAADTTIGSLSGTIATPNNGTNTATINTQSGNNFTVNQTTAGSYAGVIAGGGNVTLGSLSTSTLQLLGASSYTGGTTIAAGTLFADNATSSLGTGVVNVNGGLLAGNGTINNGANQLTVNGGNIGAGASATTTGTLTTGNQTWASGGMTIKINDTGNAISGSGVGAGTAGSTTGWDEIVMSALTLGGNLSSSPFSITLSSYGGNTAGGAIANFSPTSSYLWQIASIGNGTPLTGGNGTAILAQTDTSGNNIPADSNGFVLNTSSFVTANGSAGDGTYFLEAIDGSGGETLDIGYSYNNAPEPGTAMLILAGALPMLTRRRRRRHTADQ